jgi:hypothetical protein
MILVPSDAEQSTLRILARDQVSRQDGRFTSSPKMMMKWRVLRLPKELKSRQDGNSFSRLLDAFPEGLSTSYFFLAVAPFLCVLAVLVGCGARLCEVVRIIFGS